QQLVTLTVDSGAELALRLGPTICSSSNSSNNNNDNSDIISDSPGSGPILKGVRIVVKGGGKLTVGMAVVSLDVESATAGEGTSTLTLEGAAQQVSNGGALEVERGGTAVFLVPVRFKGNSVAHGFSGGALHADGEVTFKHAAHFEGNRVDPGEESRGQGRQSCGGGVSVGASGRVKFSEFTSLEENSAGRGGALCNRGWVRFFRRSFFNANHARGGVTVGGDGGAVCAEEGSHTIFTRKSTFLMNWAAGSGGGVYNAGVAMFETSATFRGNDAAAAAEAAAAGKKGPVETGGGHVFNRGYLRIKGDASFREGFSANDGGAVYTVSGEDTVLGGITSFEGNTADGNCKDLFSAVEGSEVKLTTTTPTTTIPPHLVPPTTPAPGTTAEASTSTPASAMSTPPLTTTTATGTTTATIVTQQQRRVSRLDSSSDTINPATNTSRGKSMSTQSAESPSRRRTNPCQP
ncbi:unnamed protein product, partial [Hapterophycus canaliculatus]